LPAEAEKMNDTKRQEPETDPELEEYTVRCHAAWGELLAAAKAKEELQFAMALNPEVRGEQSAGWSTAEESSRALDQYLELLKKLDPSPIKVRLALSLYSHLSEASGFYEIPKNMMRIASGDDYHLWPFQHLVAKYTVSGGLIVPNANKIMKDLLGHSNELGLNNIKSVIIENL
jgi:hypothetical protein